MSDLKSKLPDLNELGSMAGKLYKDLKTSVCEIIDDYKSKHPSQDDAPKAPAAKPKESAKKAAAKSEKRE